MRSSLTDLKEYLFDTLDTITNDSLSDSQIDKESKRAKAVTAVADKIIGISRLQLDAIKTQHEMGLDVGVPEEILGIENGE